MPDEPQDKPDEKDDPLTAIKDVLAGLPESIQASVVQGLQSAISTAAPPDEPDEPDDEPEPDVSDDDIERMSRKEFGNMIAGKVLKAIKPQMLEFDKRMSGVSLDGQKTALKQAIDDASARHPDFWDWKDEMLKITKELPGLDPQSVYDLAKGRNPEKVKELEDKKQSEKDEADAKGDRPNRRFGGLTPTSNSEKIKSEKMKPKEAAEAAWEEAMSDLPQELIGSSN